MILKEVFNFHFHCPTRVQLCDGNLCQQCQVSAKCLAETSTKAKLTNLLFFSLLLRSFIFFFIVIFASKTSRAAYQQVSLMQLRAHGAVYTDCVIVKCSQFLSPLFKWRKANVHAGNAEANEHQIKLLFLSLFH